MIEESLKLAYGEHSDLIKDKRIAAVQSLSGTGACRIFDDFQKRFHLESQIYIPVPTWAKFQDIDEIGTCFTKDVSDPHGYNKSDYYVEIEADMKRELERREQEKKRSQKVDFVAGGTQPRSASAANKINFPIQGVSTVVTSGLIPVPNAVDAVSRDCRLNKKSKWDKVDGDWWNPVPPSGGQDIGAHATLLSAANAGAGYTAFARRNKGVTKRKRKYPSSWREDLDP